MSAAALALPPLHSQFDDRSLSDEGSALRDSLDEARDPIDQRGEEIYSRLEAALRKADREDGTLISPETFRRAIEFITMLPPDIPIPEIVVENESELGLDWDEGANQVLSLTIRETPFVGFAAMSGPLEPTYGRVAVVSGIPDILEVFLQRLRRKNGSL